jgi:hypothetical protein
LAAVTYFIICFSLSKLVRKIQTKVAIIRWWHLNLFNQAQHDRT